MLKVRVQGTKSDIRWFREKLEQHPQIAGYRYLTCFPIKELQNIFVCMQR